MRRAWASEQLIETSAPDTHVVDLTGAGGSQWPFISCSPDAAARVELAHALEEEGGVLGWAVSLLSSFPLLAAVVAVLDFTGADIRPTTRHLTAGGVLGEVALLYGERFKQSWWSIATPLSLNGGAPAAAAAAPRHGRRAGLSWKVGLSVTSTGGRLVVISVRASARLAMRGRRARRAVRQRSTARTSHVFRPSFRARAASLAGLPRGPPASALGLLLLLPVGRRSEMALDAEQRFPHRGA